MPIRVTMKLSSLQTAADYYGGILMLLGKAKLTEADWQKITALTIASSYTCQMCKDMRWEEFCGKSVCYVCPIFNICQAKDSLYYRTVKAAEARDKAALVSSLQDLRAAVLKLKAESTADLTVELSGIGQL
jgi:hypothetical protein